MGLKVLVIEDERLSLNIATSAINSLGHKADAASSQLRGLECLQRNTYDLVICDVYGDADLRDIIQIAKAKSRGNAKVILWSADTSDALHEFAKNVHADGWTQKVFADKGVSTRWLIAGIRDYFPEF